MTTQLDTRTIAPMAQHKYKFFGLCVAVVLERAYIYETEATIHDIGSRDDWFYHHLVGKRYLALAGLIPWP